MLWCCVMVADVCAADHIVPGIYAVQQYNILYPGLMCVQLMTLYMGLMPSNSTMRCTQG